MIKVGIVGYGNLGRGVTLAVDMAKDMECVGIFTRRDPESINPVVNFPVYSMDKLQSFKGEIDVLLLCGGSATDLPKNTANLLKDFNTVDSFDTHAKIPEYYDSLEKVAKENGTLSAISIGWDPGVFSIARMLFGAVLPNGKDYTFWGKGVSQGHSDAIRRIDGVKNAIQYTIPKEQALESVRAGENPTLTTREKHMRECFVAVEDGADKERIEKEIKEMPNYFADYDTIVNFVSEEEVKEMQQKLSHGGFVFRSGNTTDKNSHLLELSLKLDSNPEFTGSVLTAYGRAVARLSKEGKTGVVTVFDVPLKYLSPMDEKDLIKNLL
ncbi:MAG: diaminopimelate dehydrogenase [Clostridiales bacterium]|nr:diaminopimelate dehydrogenase [Clostridiales bacterium]